MQDQPAPSAIPEAVIYADGAASPNPGAGGYGVVVLRAGERRELSGGFRRTTNNRMELLGAIVGLRELGTAPARVTLYSDSKYLVDMFNGGYAAKWRAQAWTRNKGKDPAVNPDLWNQLLDLGARHQLQFVWVRGHQENAENIRCDELAVLARQAKTLPPDTGYESPFIPGGNPQLNLF
jgi:ribonuclease HI